MQILIVDDEPAHAELIRRSLEESGLAAGIRVAGTLREYRDTVANDPPDIALVDLNLPDGRAVEILSSPPESGSFPILIMTSHGTEQAAVEALKSGAMDYVVKSSATFADIHRTVMRSLREWKLLQERKSSEEELSESNRRLKLATSSANLGIWEWDIASDTLLPDERTLELYGIAGNSPTTQHLTWKYVLHCDDYDRTIAALEESLLHNRTLDVEYRITRPDGTIRHIKSNAIIMRTDAGAAFRMIGLNQDITEQKILEAQFHQSQKMESIGRLAGGIAHDFNNMLNVILGYVHLGLMETDSSQPLHSYFTQISKAADHSAGLTRQLLAFASKQSIIPKVLNLNEAVTGMLKMLQRLIGEDIKLIWQPADDVWPVKMDPTQIDQILANLCVNARDAIANIGHIIIRTVNCAIDESDSANHPGVASGEYVCFEVIDNGCGIDQAILAKIFEPFFTTKAKGVGTGLGLATVYGIVVQNKGFINVSSEPGQGTTIQMYLPRHVGALAQICSMDELDAAPHGRETILLVEDEQEFLTMCSMILKSLGYNVLTANSPGEAMNKAYLRDVTIHLLVSDVVMPEMNGYRLYQKLHSLNPQLKSLFMSGYSAESVALNGVQAKEMDFIQKPFSIPEFAAKIREVLDRCMSI